MNSTPTYDWEWFASKTPFKKILTDTCGLSISKEIEKIPIIFGCYHIINHYVIKVNFKAFQNNFKAIKAKLLDTRVCKHNSDIFNFVQELECKKQDLCSLIINGCMKEPSGSFEWDWCE